MKKILITNDDGYESSGLKILVSTLKAALKNRAQIIVVAPASEKSACGHGLTLTKPLRLLEVEEDFYKLDDGTPSDCVYLALNALFKNAKKPDLILSGINIGANLGEDVTYSGTVAGAMEGAIREIPAIALSQVLREKNDPATHDFSLAAEVSAEIVERVLGGGFPLLGRKLLNVNFPFVKKPQYRGLKITQLGYRIFGNDAHRGKSPRGFEYFWLGLHPLKWDKKNDENSDFRAVFEGYTSITPIMLDMTSVGDLAGAQKWLNTK